MGESINSSFTKIQKICTISFLEDYLDVLKVSDIGVPHNIYVQEDKFNTLNELLFYKKFRSSKQTILFCIIIYRAPNRIKSVSR